MSDFADVTTERLHLSAMAAEPVLLRELHEVLSDPRVWTHHPTGLHTEPAQTAAAVERFAGRWARDGLGMWAVRRRPVDGVEQPLIGLGGCDVRHDAFWNVGYRFAPQAWGHGFAQEVVTAGRAAATALRPGLPHVAYLLESNDRSRRSAERAGLELVWRGPDHGNPDPDAVRLVMADRPLDARTLRAATENL